MERRGPRLVARGGFKSDCEKFQAGLHNRPLWYKGSNFLRFLLNGPIVCILFDYDFDEHILFSLMEKNNSNTLNLGPNRHSSQKS